MRARDSSEQFRNFLLSVGNGSTGENVIIPPNLIVPKDQMISKVFGDALEVGDTTERHRRVLLCSNNRACADLNTEILNRTPGREVPYYSTDSILDTEQINGDPRVVYPPGFINTFNPASIPQHELRLKVGVPVMLLRNINVERGLTNGTRLIVQSLHKRYMVGRTIPSTNKPAEVVMIPRIDLTSGEKEFPVRIKRRQFPIKLWTL